MPVRFVVFSDIHGRLDALTAMLARIQNRALSGAVFCGDIVRGDGNAPEIVRAMRSLPNLLAVRGNNDHRWRDVVRDKYGGSPPPALAEAYAYIASLPRVIDTVIGGYRVFVCHGSPARPLAGRIYEDTVMDAVPECDFMFPGHTHCRMQRAVNGCRIVNLGSLGMPRDGKGRSYCPVDFSTGEVAHQSLEMQASCRAQEMSLLGCNVK